MAWELEVGFRHIWEWRREVLVHFLSMNEVCFRVMIPSVIPVSPFRFVEHSDNTECLAVSRRCYLLARTKQG